MNCQRCDQPLSGKQLKWCSSSCKNNNSVAQRRRHIKEKAIAHKGGKCERCGYNRSVDALSFHHVGVKEFGISEGGYTHSWEAVLKELEQCILLCANCHMEEHARMRM